MNLSSVLFASCLIGIVVCNHVPNVKITNGKLSGTFATTNNGATYMQFLGIPYAKPPIGKLRFMEPQPLEQQWPEVWIANMTCECIQVDMRDQPQEGVTKGTEDCLYINVFVPGSDINPKGNFDVIVHIHGGAFMFGSAFGYSNPRSFMDNNVIFVTFNYRLGVFGFLSTEDKHLAGNLGMKDQVMALKWLKKNIKYFGGNPNSITLTGLSAGGASVQYHLISPMSKGLFHKAISTSGTVLNQWSQQKESLLKAKIIGDAVGCIYTNTLDFLRCLKTKPALQLVEATKLLRRWAYIPSSPLGVLVDDQAEEPFMPIVPKRALELGKIYDVPWITSLTTDEGLFPIAQLFVREEYFPQLKENWDEYITILLHYHHTLPKSQWKEIAQKIKRKYLGDKQIGLESYKEIIQIASDRLFVADIETSARMHAKAIKSSVYFYQFNYTAEVIPSFAETLYHFKEKYGVGHGDDIMLIFDSGVVGSKEDQEMSQILINMWVNFAKTGEPGIKSWTSISRNTKLPLNYLYIGSPSNIVMREGANLGHNEFWASLPFAANENVAKQNVKIEL